MGRLCVVLVFLMLLIMILKMLAMLVVKKQEGYEHRGAVGRV